MSPVVAFTACRDNVAQHGGTTVGQALDVVAGHSTRIPRVTGGFIGWAHQ
jgi:UDP-N-acetyl-D-mannosaminuronic acid transferase (WecB/TagA/CpsF family)